MVCTKKQLLVLIVESRGFFGSANNASCLDNAFVSLHIRIPPRVLHFSAFIYSSFERRRGMHQYHTFSSLHHVM